MDGVEIQKLLEIPTPALLYAAMVTLKIRKACNTDGTVYDHSRDSVRNSTFSTSTLYSE